MVVKGSLVVVVVGGAGSNQLKMLRVWKSESESHSVVSDSLWLHGLYSPWNSPGQDTGVGSLFLLQGIFPTQGSNPGLPHCRQILYQLNLKGSPRILKWVAYPFSSRSSWPRNWSWVFCRAGRFFTNCYGSVERVIAAWIKESLWRSRYQTTELNTEARLACDMGWGKNC